MHITSSPWKVGDGFIYLVVEEVEAQKASDKKKKKDFLLQSLSLQSLLYSVVF